MARHSKKFSSDQPSLFDQPAPRLPFGTLDNSLDSLPVHPSIARRAAMEALEGGRPTATHRPADEAEALDEIDRTQVGRTKRPMMFISFGSGSSGNCSYVGNGSEGFLIDAGVNPLHVEKTLLHNAITMDSIKGICLTHDHSDHIQYAYTLLRKYRHMKLFCTPKTLNGILRRHNVSRRIKDYHSPIYKEFPFRIGTFDIVAFDVNHDGTDNAGYFITYDTTEAPSTMAIATDLGSITERVDFYMRQAAHIVIESNYDPQMLTDGYYTERLKDRIRSDHGHLSNDDTARFLAEIYTPRLRDIYLCHLSHDNNTPELALAASRSALLAAGLEAIGDGSASLEASRAPLQLSALPRYDATRLFTFVERQI